jgi:hypothetical protein
VALIGMATETTIRIRPTKRDQYCDLVRNAILAIELQRRTIHGANIKIAETLLKLEEDLASMREECGVGSA